MVDVSKKAMQIEKLIERRKYIVINRPPQYGKTALLIRLQELLQDRYYVISLNFKRTHETVFSSEQSFLNNIVEQFAARMKSIGCPKVLTDAWTNLQFFGDNWRTQPFPCFQQLIDRLCALSDRGIVLIIDDIDHNLSNDIILNFLAVLRESYFARQAGLEASFQSVILASVTDIKNLKSRLYPEEHWLNSPWNIAVDFNVDMSFSTEEIAMMLQEFEADHRVCMDVMEIASLLHEYTSGYPFFVSRICYYIDALISGSSGFETGSQTWTKDGCLAAVKVILEEDNSLFDSMFKCLADHPDLNHLLRSMLFEGKTYAFNPDDAVYTLGRMYGFLKSPSSKLCSRQTSWITLNAHRWQFRWQGSRSHAIGAIIFLTCCPNVTGTQNGTGSLKKQGTQISISNKIIETRLYNYLLDKQVSF